MSSSIPVERSVLARKRKALGALDLEIKAREGKLRMLEAKAADAKAAKQPVTVEAGTVVIMVRNSEIKLSTEVRLRGKVRYGEGCCYELAKSTGDPEKDKWIGGHDFCSPTFLRKEAAKKWDQLAKQMNQLIEAEVVLPASKCNCN